MYVYVYVDVYMQMYVYVNAYAYACVTIIVVVIVIVEKLGVAGPQQQSNFTCNIAVVVWSNVMSCNVM